MTLKVGTDCSGIEAPIQALKKLKIPYKHMFSSDIDKNVIKSIKANYNPKILFGDPDGPFPNGDIRKRKISDVPDIDLYVCGFPCQPFSVVGNRKGIKDKRGNVFQECLRVIKSKNPKYFLLENVPGILSVNKGKTWRRIEDELIDLGNENNYYIHCGILNTKDYGIPQSRKRLFIVGTKKKGFEWPRHCKMKNIRLFIDQKDNSKTNMTPALKRFHNYSLKNGVFIDRSFSNTKHSNSDKYCPCILTNGLLYCKPKKRNANVKEYLALQGFPKNFKQNISDSQMKKQIGNSMTVNVIECIFKSMFN